MVLKLELHQSHLEGLLGPVSDSGGLRCIYSSNKFPGDADTTGPKIPVFELVHPRSAGSESPLGEDHQVTHVLTEV